MRAAIDYSPRYGIYSGAKQIESGMRDGFGLTEFDIGLVHLQSTNQKPHSTALIARA